MEQIIDVPGRRIQEKLVEVIQLILQERISERIGDKLALRIQETLFEVIRLIRREQNSERVVETLVDAPVPQIQKRPVEVNTFNEFTNAVRTEETQNQSLEENTLHPSSERFTRSSAVTWVREASKSGTHVGSCTVSNVAHVARSLTGKRPVSMYQDEDETNKTEVEGKNGMEKNCVATKNTVTEEKLNFKSEARDKHRTEKAVQDARNWLNKNKLAEIDEFEAQQKELEGAERVNDTSVAAQHQPVVMQRQGATLQATQKTVEVPQIQYIDKIVDAPVVVAQQPVPMDAETLSQDQCFQRIEDDSVAVKQQGCEKPLSPKKRRLPVETESGFESGKTTESRCRVESRAVQGRGLTILSIVPRTRDPLCKHCLQ